MPISLAYNNVGERSTSQKLPSRKSALCARQLLVIVYNNIICLTEMLIEFARNNQDTGNGVALNCYHKVHFTANLKPEEEFSSRHLERENYRKL